MIDWIARARFSQKGCSPAAKTDESPISSVSSVPVTSIQESREPVSSVSSVGIKAAPEKRELEPTGVQDGAWTDADIAHFLDRRARLLRWGWTEQQAEAVAEHLTRRDADDDRRMCVECRHCRPGLICATYRAAGVGRELGRDLATLLQRCPAFAPHHGLCE